MDDRSKRLFGIFVFLAMAACSSSSVNETQDNGGTAGKGGAPGGGGASGGNGGAPIGGGGAPGGTAGTAGGSGGIAGSGGTAATAGDASSGGFGQAIKWAGGACSTRADANTQSLRFGGSESFTIELWYEFDSVGAQSQRLVGKGALQDTNAGWLMYLSKQFGDAGAFYWLMFCTSDGSKRNCDHAPQMLQPNTPYHLVVEYDAANTKFTTYVRSASESTHASHDLVGLATTWTNTEKFSISDCSGYPAIGTMDALLIWNTVRILDELETDAKPPQACGSNGQLGSFQFDDFSTNQIIDCSGNLNYTDLNGPTTYSIVTSPFG